MMEKKTEKVHDLDSTLIFEEEESEVSQAEKKAKKKKGIGGLNSTQKAQEYMKGESKAPQLPNVKTSKNSGGK